MARNPWKGGVRGLLRKLSCELRKQQKALDGQPSDAGLPAGGTALDPKPYYDGSV